jgi:hypothetical protein
MPASVQETAIYTRDDGIVDWRTCITKKPEVDFEVAGTHVGMTFNPSAYIIIAERLARAQVSEPPPAAQLKRERARRPRGSRRH